MPGLSVILTRGLPASGKSTWARLQAAQYGWATISRDDVRSMLGANEKTLYGRDGEDTVTRILIGTVDAMLTSNLSVVVEATHRRREQAAPVIRLAGRHGARVTVRDFQLPLDVLISHNAARPHAERVPESVIRRMFAEGDGMWAWRP